MSNWIKTKRLSIVNRSRENIPDLRLSASKWVKTTNALPLMMPEADKEDCKFFVYFYARPSLSVTHEVIAGYAFEGDGGAYSYSSILREPIWDVTHWQIMHPIMQEFLFNTHTKEII
jgi:hypothetical protein